MAVASPCQVERQGYALVLPTLQPPWLAKISTTRDSCRNSVPAYYDRCTRLHLNSDISRLDAMMPEQNDGTSKNLIRWYHLNIQGAME
jgi:hypothetical protein